MIRRNPTLVPMSDLDVQDIRDLVASQKAEHTAKTRAQALVKKASDKPQADDGHLYAQLKRAYLGLKAKEAELLRPQPSTSASTSGAATVVAGPSGECIHFDHLHFIIDILAEPSTSRG
jgi:hypothetical protein